ncbi:MAG: hypothetical protein AAB686_01805, partial [Patescibacteria group bacterium]
SYEQIHYRWRNDNGSESAATFPILEDVQYNNFPKDTVLRLRLEVSNEGWTRGSSQSFRLEYASSTDCATAAYTAMPGNSSANSEWRMATSTYLTDGEATTNVTGGLTDENAAFAAGQVKTTGNTTSATTLTSENFTEVEYSVTANASAASGVPYCFRLTNNGSATNYTYTKYPKAVISGGYPAAGEITSVALDTTGSADGPAYNSIMWKGTLPAGTRVRFQLATAASTGGPWNYIGGASCNSSSWYEPSAPDTPVEITCAPQNHNEQRYFRYRAQLCSSSDCSTAGSDSPTVDSVIVNWSP